MSNQPQTRKPENIDEALSVLEHFFPDATWTLDRDLSPRHSRPQDNAFTFLLIVGEDRFDGSGSDPIRVIGEVIEKARKHYHELGKADAP